MLTVQTKERLSRTVLPALKPLPIPRPKTVTANGDAIQTTAQFKFSSKSGVFDGTGDYLSLADSEDWNFGTGDFTIDCWVRFNTVAGYQTFGAQYVDINNFWEFYKSVDDQIIFRQDTGGSATLIVT